MLSTDSFICEALCLLLFFQVIRLGGKYVYAQADKIISG